MCRASDQSSAWRAFAAVLAAFALGVQLLIAGLLAGSLVRAAGDGDLTAICSHEMAVDPANGPTPADPAKSHDLCQVCTCLQSGKLVLTLPTPPLLDILRGPSERVPARGVASSADRHFHSPYASRAPPRAA